MQTKENSFIKNFISSIKDFEKYPEMASKPFSKVIKYLLKLMLIFTFVVAIIAVFDVSKEIKTSIEYIDENLPDIEFSNNELKVKSEEKIAIEANNIFDLILINTNDISEEELNNYIKDIESHNTGAVLLKDKIVINMGTGTIQYSYEKLADMYNIQNMTKQDIINNFNGTNLIMIYIAIFIIYFIWLFVSYITSTLLDSLILGIIGYFTSLILKLRIKFIAMIKIAIHALTLPIILNLIYIILQTVFNFKIKYFEIMYIAVSYIYIVTAILMIKSDLIKRGQELTKIIEEERKIKEQMQREKEEKERQEEEEKRKKQEEKKKQEKKEKENKKEGLSGGEPQGENA